MLLSPYEKIFCTLFALLHSGLNFYAYHIFSIDDSTLYLVHFTNYMYVIILLPLCILCFLIFSCPRLKQECLTRLFCFQLCRWIPARTLSTLIYFVYHDIFWPHLSNVFILSTKQFFYSIHYFLSKFPLSLLFQLHFILFVLNFYFSFIMKYRNTLLVYQRCLFHKYRLLLTFMQDFFCCTYLPILPTCFWQCYNTFMPKVPGFLVLLLLILLTTLDINMVTNTLDNTEDTCFFQIYIGLYPQDSINFFTPTFDIDIDKLLQMIIIYQTNSIISDPYHLDVTETQHYYIPTSSKTSFTL